MTTKRLRVILLAFAACIATTGAIFYFDSDRRGDSYTMVNVGGKTNTCTCSQRLER